MTTTPPPPDERAPERAPTSTGTIDIQREGVPLRIRVVAGYLSVTGTLGLIGCAAVTALGLGLSGPSALMTAPAKTVAIAVFTAVSSLIAARALRRRERQGAIMAVALFASPLVYGLTGTARQGIGGLFSVLGIVAVLSVWKYLD